VTAQDRAVALDATFATRWYAKYLLIGVMLLAVPATLVFSADVRLLALSEFTTHQVAEVGALFAFLGAGSIVAMRSRACTGCGAEAKMKYFWVAIEAGVEVRLAVEGGSAERIVEVIVAHRRAFWQPSKLVSCLHCAGCLSLATLEVTGWKKRTLLGQDARRFVAFVIADDVPRPGTKAPRPPPPAMDVTVAAPLPDRAGTSPAVPAASLRIPRT
jgi:hypothetical protein